ncbi:diguanylate cyclase [Shewanella surugensis]|uniref:diguanylate cyclase n=1 Tax=Shewanella surugensis TaxID=212020 RepID=A0ABT0LD96_9GAMM|nr:diguanylate cyclase [Shewanella surugensis]MCL1125678.1 diguanylate cyclase [Shewanella surugensis]
MINLYPVLLIANIPLILGNIVVVIAAILLGPWYALLTAIICVSGLMLLWASPHVYLIFGLEALWLGFAKRKNVYALYASIAYWLLLGMPLFYLYATFFTHIPSASLPFIALKQSINALIYTSLGALIVLIVPYFWHFKTKIIDSQRRTFNAQLTYTFTLVVTLSLLSSTLLFNNQFIKRQKATIYDNLNDSVVHLGTFTSVFLSEHLKAINNAAHWLSIDNQGQEDWQYQLTSLHQSYPSFITMLLADKKGNVIAASPKADLDLSLKPNIADRDYFQQAFFYQQRFISSVFLGRGFGNDPIVAISAPIYSPKQKHNPIAIIEGSLNLNQFAQIDHANTQNHQQAMLLVDGHQKVIYASKMLMLKPLTSLKMTLVGEEYETGLPMMNIIDTKNPMPEFIYAAFKLKNGWTLYALNPLMPLIKLIEELYLATFAILIIALLVTLYITRVVSLRLTQPLELIAKDFGQKHTTTLDIEQVENEAPQEIYDLHQRIQKSKQTLINYQSELENSVTLRTQELEKANVKLKSLSEIDPLTGLCNRRSAELKFNTLHEINQRNNETMVVALLDLDHFKQVNDIQGHLGGDEALKAISALLVSTFKRDTDVISRFGGEEFLLILSFSEPLKIEAHLNHFREKLAQTRLSNPLTQAHFTVTTSIGAIMASPRFSASLEDWIKQADINLYKAKDSGRNKVIYTQIS